MQRVWGRACISSCELSLLRRLRSAILAPLRLYSEAIFLIVITKNLKATREWLSEQNLNFSVVRHLPICLREEREGMG